jgi:serine/threonine-protein kinase
MNPTPLPVRDVLPPELARRVDQLCNRYETAWRGDHRPRIDDFLAEAEDLARPVLLRELVELEVFYRRSRGEVCRLEEYGTRFPLLDPTWLAEVISTSEKETPLSAAQVGTPQPDETLAGQPAAPARRRVGGYVLLDEIARGGMGVVYRAQQLRPRRLVALKMILAGTHASPAEVQRFRAEAEAAAHLDHPNIVPIYEVGDHEGQPFFSMKLVEGGSLASAVVSGQWSVVSKDTQRGVARLLATVARAVHYAHQRGILHRDLKPANILLSFGGRSPSDAAPAPLGERPLNEAIPHVTDFGLARRVEGGAGLTHSGALVGTPSYMAPEQAAGTKGLSTAIDVYALGAILYELLTGRPPFQGATPLETLQQVAEREPERPRTRNRQVDRDLEVICLKCLEKEPARRYGSAEGLADDLERWLRGEPILARAASRRERLWRWCRRNPALAGVSAGMILVLLGGIAGVGWQWLRAERHAREAEARRQKTHEAVREYFTRVSENKLLGRPAMQDLRKDLLESALHYFQEFLAERGDDPQMRAEVAATGARVAIILDQTGAKEEARSAFQDALALYQKMADADPSDLGAAGGLARTYNQLGDLYSRMSALDQALDALNRAREILEKLTENHPEKGELQSELATTHRHLAGVQARKGLRTAALDSLDQAVAIGRGLVQLDPDRSDYHLELSATYNAVGDLHVAALRWKEALPAFEKARDLLEPLARSRPTDIDLQSKLTDNQGKVANAYNRNGRLEDAVRVWQEVRDKRERLAYENPAVVEFQWDLAVAYCFLGKQYSQKKEFTEALACWQQAFPVVEKLLRINPTFPDYRLRLADLNNDNAHVYSKIGRQADALRSFEQARPILEDLVRDCPDTATYRHALAINRHNNGNELRQIGRRQEARQSLERSLELCQELIATDESFLAYPYLLVHVHNQLGLLHQDANEVDQAAACYRRALEVCLKLHHAQPQMALYEQLLGTCYANLGSAARAAHQPDEAERHYRQAHDIREKLLREQAELTDVNREAAEASRDLAGLLRETGKTKEALTLFERARDHAQKAFQANPLDLRAQSVEGEAWDGIGLLLAPMGRREEAIQAHRRAIELQKTAVAKEPEQLVYHERLEKHVQNLAHLYNDMGRPDDAAAVLRELERK